MKRILIIGGGPAGMLAAVAAAEAGCDTVILEKNEKLGKKLYITGKGRCNLTNACDAGTFFANVVRNPKFMFSSYYGFSSRDMMRWIEGEGLKLKTERGNRVFPESDKASDVTRTIEKALQRLKVRIRLHTEVESLDIQAGICRGVILTDGSRVPADGVIVATGGLSYPTTGSTGDGFRFAREAGLAVTELLPSLVGIDACFGDGSPVGPCRGLSLKNVKVSAFRGKKQIYEEFGEMLFTDQGVSGPVILTLSSACAEVLSGESLLLLIDLKPALTETQLNERLLREFDAAKNKQIGNVMRKLLPGSMIEPVLKISGLDETCPVHHITKEQRQNLIRTLKALPLKLIAARGFREAVVTRGGVSVKEIDPSTMSAKKIRGLYFAGEVLDVDAFTGGFNLQVAWSTGHAAGKGAAYDEFEYSN